MWGYAGEYGWPWWWWGAGLVHMLLFWGLIVLGIAALAKWLFAKPAGAGGAREKTPLDILKERYARGEVNREEFEQKKRDLEA
ncbi:MAG: hypothetical protein A2151_03740 [Candidatus Muproteobacteria bacterium RBG_16_65_34]|uniref:SHOCT domain-containing protein n=1 Tax=Candidatus Muproteobacteria bacterium RBG_16_65_34 TaxID=1817760 RepID=A0A1F6TN62_9PROT|nr:MAG: hypothetical protein A2151_03740 [Candidatus Muproteobacteria bacterium RBG_16_65_34]